MEFSLKVILILVIIQSYAAKAMITTNHIEIIDKNRSRIIPLEIYENHTKNQLPVIIISQGYSVKNTEYSFIANALAARGYFVISLQHDLKSDPALPVTGNIFLRRKPTWERGVQNILFTIAELKKNKPNLNLEKVILIGHSNGGDISMMFADFHPKRVEKLVSLDSLRYPFPTKNHIPILSLRANDTNADDGVLPKTGASIVMLKNAKHIELCDRGTLEINKEMADLILNFLEGETNN
jgi:hypothetical protein